MTWFLVLGLLFGAEVQAGPLGVLAVLLIGVTAGIGFGAVGVLLALRAKSASTVQGIFPLVFVVLFVSSAFFPLDLLSAPSAAVAAYNPLSYVAEGLREPIAFGDDLGPVLAGLASALGIALVFVALAVVALHTRLREP
jgi:ABC-2 type transport system permease protein